MLLPNIDVETIEELKSMLSEFPDCTKGMMGLHPTSVDADYKKALDVIYQELQNGNYTAVGEIGIDLYWDKTFLKEQIDAFTTQAKWAQELNLPIAIHARNSFPELLEAVDGINDSRLRGVFHCFTGNVEQAEHIVGYGDFYLGIGGVLTYKNSGLAETLAKVDPNFLVLETDSPYLAPVPHRGKRNETSYMLHVADKLAEVYALPIEKIAEITTANAQKLFAL